MAFLFVRIQNVHTAFMRTVPSYARQTEVWADLLDKLGFKLVIFIHSSDQEGRAMLGKFQSKTESENKKVGQLHMFIVFVVVYWQLIVYGLVSSLTTVGSVLLRSQLIMQDGQLIVKSSQAQDR